MLISEWFDDWGPYVHADLEHEASLEGVYVGSHRTAVLHFERSDGKHATIRLQKEEAKKLANLILDLYS